MVASFATGALCGSLTMTKLGSFVRPARTMLVCCTLWYAALMVFARMPTHLAGCTVLLFTGAAQSMGMVAMSTLILRSTSGHFRARVMGIRMLAIYGLPIGLLIAGQLITHIGHPWTATLYCLFGIGVTTLIAIRWRQDVWRADAPANAR